MKDNKTLAGVATQIVFEYPEWGCDHVADMIATYDATGEPKPGTVDDLYDACLAAERFVKAGYDYSAVELATFKQLSR